MRWWILKLLVKAVEVLCGALSKKICVGKGARECPQLDGLFNYIKGHSGGDWGVVGGTWHAMGKEYTSGNGKTYAYCVMQ